MKKYIVITILIIMILLVGFLVKKSWKVNTEIEVVSTYHNPIIPEGFQKIETESASWEITEGIPVGWNNGLVIEDKIGNQFVWIPVNLEDEEYIQLSANDNWCFKKENMQKENREDLQILKYGGFYIGRYEVGMPESLQGNNTNIGSEVNNIKEIPVSKKDILPWNFISWENAKSNSQNMYSDNKNVSSDLISMKMLSAVTYWLDKTGYDTQDSKKVGQLFKCKF